MAKQYGKDPAVDFAAANLMSFGKSFSRLNGQPLDKSEVWYDLEALRAYAQTDAAYVGQKVFYVDSDNGKVTHYGIELDGSLKELGAATLGDNKSIDLGDGNILSLHNYGKQYYKYDAEAESHYTLVVVDDEHPFPAGLQPKTVLSSDGSTIELAWFEPSTTTVEGLSEQMSSVTQTVNTMQSAVTNNTQAIQKMVEKEEGKGLSSNDYTSEDKEKLAGIAEGAQVNVIEAIKVNGETQAPQDKIIDITVPTKISDLEDDSNFIDNTVSNLVNYYQKSETFNKQEVQDLISAIRTMDIQKVDELPTTDISSTTIYLVPKEGSESDVYNEYVFIESTSTWELIGNTQIDLSGYLQKTGDASDVTVAFTEAATRELPVTGESLKDIAGKIIKYLTDLKNVAFTGKYEDLEGKPANTPAFVTGVLAAGETSVSITYPSGRVSNVNIVDRATGETIFADVTISSTSVTVSIAAAYTADLDITVCYYV